MLRTVWRKNVINEIKKRAGSDYIKHMPQYSITEPPLFGTYMHLFDLDSMNKVQLIDFDVNLGKRKIREDDIEELSNFMDYVTLGKRKSKETNIFEEENERRRKYNNYVKQGRVFGLQSYHSIVVEAYLNYVHDILDENKKMMIC